MFEQRHHPTISLPSFMSRMFAWFSTTFILFAISLFFGMAGYRYFENMLWIDAFLNAAMILGGMGEIDTLNTTGGKIFAGCYAIYSGFFLVICGGLLLAPIFHRILHQFHAEN
jgi:hypothetical protein